MNTIQASIKVVQLILLFKKTAQIMLINNSVQEGQCKGPGYQNVVLWIT